MKYVFNFKFIKIIAYYFAKKIQIIRQESHTLRKNYYYGLQIIFGGIIKIFLLISLSLLFGVFYETLIASFAFASIRVFAGGYHMQSYTGCTYFSLVILLLLGICSKIVYILGVWNIYLFFIIFVLSVLLIFIYAPVENKNKICKKEEKFLRKIISISIILILGIITYLINNEIIYIASCMGIVLAILILFPSVNNILKLGEQNLLIIINKY